MSCLRICIGVGLLVGLSGTVFASPGVVSFRGAIVEPPCPVSTYAEGFALHGCAVMAADKDGLTRGVALQGTARSIDGSSVQIKLIHAREDAGGLLSQQYALLDGRGQTLTSGKYMVTLTYP